MPSYHRAYRHQEEIKIYDTAVWVCTGTDCKVWMREDFKLNVEPDCPLCGSDMVRETKPLPEVKNESF